MAIKTKHDISKQNFTNSHGSIAIALLIFFLWEFVVFCIVALPSIEKS